MARHLIVLAAALFAVGFAVPQSNAAELPRQLKVGNDVLSLNGVGVRKKSFLSLYSAGLYLKEKSNSARQIVTADEPMSIRIEITSKFVGRDQLISALQDGFQSSTGGNVAPIQANVRQFTQFFTDDVKLGDVIDLVYVPNTGVVVVKNGQRLGIVGDLQFKQALFGIWLSGNPADANLKQSLLGG